MKNRTSLLKQLDETSTALAWLQRIYVTVVVAILLATFGWVGYSVYAAISNS
jgi:hypothetical protein